MAVQQLAFSEGASAHYVMGSVYSCEWTTAAFERLLELDTWHSVRALPLEEAATMNGG
jgi:hypothetical protein